MPVLISLLRGVNLAGHRKVKMDDLRALYESLGFSEVRTYINSGNVIFKTAARDPARLRKRIEDAIESTFGFRSDVVLRTVDDLKTIIAANPFAARQDIEPNRFAVHFLANDLDDAVRRQVMAIDIAPEELHAIGRELYVYYANGMSRPKLSLAQVEKMMKTIGTSRNWNTVRKLLELAQQSK